MLYVVLAVLAVTAVAVAAPMLRRNTRLDEVDRFHVARTLTSSWAGGTPPAHGESADEA